MKIAVVSSMDTGMMGLLERIRESAMSLNMTLAEPVPVMRAIDIPMAVRRAAEMGVDSVLVAAEFPEMKMEHEKPLFERIISEVNAIGTEMNIPVSTELMSAEIGEIDAKRMDEILKGLMKEDSGNPF